MLINSGRISICPAETLHAIMQVELTYLGRCDNSILWRRSGHPDNNRTAC